MTVVTAIHQRASVVYMLFAYAGPAIYIQNIMWRTGSDGSSMQASMRDRVFDIAPVVFGLELIVGISWLALSRSARHSPLIWAMTAVNLIAETFAILVFIH